MSIDQTTNTSPNLPKISIITPSFNQGQYIEDTIVSIIGQDYPNIEYIVIDGGSSDNTIDILKKYNDRITYWISEKDAGQSNAINKGFKKATGEILNWINSDDQLMPGALRKIADYFQKHKDVVMIHGRIEYFGEVEFNFTSTNISLKDIQTKYAAHICMPQPATFYRKQLLDEQGLLDETLQFSMDTDLYVRAGLNYKILQIEDVLAKFRLHSTSKSVSTTKKKFLVENAIIFSRVMATLSSRFGIESLKMLKLYTEPRYLYKKPFYNFNDQKLMFYFLQHRLYTLYSHGEKKEFRRLFSFLFQKYTSAVITSKKLMLYRITLFLSPFFFHKLSRRKHRV